MFDTIVIWVLEGLVIGAALSFFITVILLAYLITDVYGYDEYDKEYEPRMQKYVEWRLENDQT